MRALVVQERQLVILSALHGRQRKGRSHTSHCFSMSFAASDGLNVRASALECAEHLVFVLIPRRQR
jgi:hypothetical protein